MEIIMNVTNYIRKHKEMTDIIRLIHGEFVLHA